MKFQVKRLIIVFTMLAVLVSAFTVFAEAEDGDESDGEEMLLENVLLDNDDAFLTIRSTQMMCSLAFTKKTSTTADAVVKMLADEIGDTVTSTITLQKLASSGSYINTSAAAAVQTVKKTDTLVHRATFKISSNNDYRIKVVIKLTKGGTTTTNTFYKKML